MPFLATLEEEHMPALTLHWPGLHVLQIDTLAHVKTRRGMKVQWTSPDLHFDGVAAVRAGAPAQQSVALDETVGDEVLVLELDPGVGKYFFLHLINYFPLSTNLGSVIRFMTVWTSTTMLHAPGHSII